MQSKIGEPFHACPDLGILRLLEKERRSLLNWPLKDLKDAAKDANIDHEILSALMLSLERESESSDISRGETGSNEEDDDGFMQGLPADSDNFLAQSTDEALFNPHFTTEE